MVPVALAFAVLDTGGGATGLGVVLATSTIARASFLVFGGVWSDRVSRRLVMLSTDAVRAVVQALVAAALFTDAMRLWMFVVASAVFGAASAFFGPASTGLLPEIVEPNLLQRANALLTLTRNGTSVFGPAVAGAVVAAASPAWVYVIDSLSFAASAGFLWRLQSEPQRRPTREPFLAAVATGWREVRTRRWLRRSFVLFSITNFAIAPVMVLGPVVARQSLGGARSWGLILAGTAIGGLVGGIAAYRMRPSRPLLVCYVGWILMAAPALALFPPLPVLLVALGTATFGVGVSVANSLWESLLQREIPAQSLSRVSAIDWAVSLVFIPLGTASAGTVASAIGIRSTLLGSATLILAANGTALLIAATDRQAPSGRMAAESDSPGRSAVARPDPGQPVRQRRLVRLLTQVQRGSFIARPRGGGS